MQDLTTKGNGWKTSFIDTLFNCLLVFMFMFMVAFMLVKIEAEKANIQTKAEFVITTTWQAESRDDVDSYLMDPNGLIVYFGKKEEGLAHLDRDDLGLTADSYVLPDGTTITIRYNQEITTIRGFVPGTWTFNIHMYRKSDLEGPAKVFVKIEKLNPSVKTIFIKEFELATAGQQITVARFTMDSTGNITAIDTETFVDVVSHKLIPAFQRGTAVP